MDLLNLDFNDSLIFELNGKQVRMTLLPSKDNNNKDEYAFGFEAPPEVAVNREEVYKRKQQRKRYNHRRRD